MLAHSGLDSLLIHQKDQVHFIHQNSFQPKKIIYRLAFEDMTKVCSRYPFTDKHACKHPPLHFNQLIEIS